jgi:hypothetical protein
MFKGAELLVVGITILGHNSLSSSTSSISSALSLVLCAQESDAVQALGRDVKS